MPDRTSRKTDYGVDSQHSSGMGCLNHIFDRPQVHSIGIAIAPDIIRQYGFMPLIDIITYRLADHMIRNTKQLQTVLIECHLDIPIIFRICLPNIQMRW